MSALLLHRALQFLARSDFDRPPSFSGAYICSDVGGSAASSGNDVMHRPPQICVTLCSGMAGVPVLTARECCVLASSNTMCGGDNGKVRDLISSFVARRLTLGLL